MEKLDLSPEYLAGLFDGGGSIRIDRCVDKGIERLHPVVCITFTNKDFIESLQVKLGGKIVRTHGVERDVVGWLAGYQLRWFGLNCKEILEFLMPCLVLKKEPAMLALEYVNTISYRNNKPVPTDILALREVLYTECKKFNAGPNRKSRRKI